MADIKTRDAVKGTIKTIDKAAIATERMKSAYAKQRIRRNKVVTPMKTPLRNMLPTGFPTELTVSRTRVSTN